MTKPRLSFWQIWNMSFGFLGIQFGWGLQLANMSAIYTKLGASPDAIPLLWLAGPVTGLVVQPIVGSLSDRTWGPLGRRRPYFLVGAILSAVALVVMPLAPTVRVAATLLWILDASINVSMEPFRAFVADMLPDEQRTRGFATQSLFIGLGAVVASALPWLLTNALHVEGDTIKIAFMLGGAAFLGAVLWTVVTTKEYPPDDVEAFRRRRAETRGAGAFAREIVEAIRAMPKVMRRLALVQMATWLGLFLMWFYFVTAATHRVFGATDPDSPLFKQGQEWGGLCFAVYSAVCFVAAPFLTPIAARFGRRAVHSIALVCGGLGLLSLWAVHSPWGLFVPMVGVGIAWASILAMPYVMLASALPPEKMGVYVGIFNFFIVLPEIVASLAFGWVMRNVLGNDEVAAVMLGGACLLVAAALVWLVPRTESTPFDASA